MKCARCKREIKGWGTRLAAIFAMAADFGFFSLPITMAAARRPAHGANPGASVNSFVIASVVFGGSFVAALIGMLLHVKLPDRHFDADSKDVIKLVMGLIGTMAALILGLLIASANSMYNEQSSALQSLSAKIVCLID